MQKPTKKAISYVIYNKDRSQFLIVQRPSDDDDLPDAWGLPAGSLKEKETYEDAAIRSGKEKLGVELRIVKLINEGDIEREDYTLHMKEFEAEIVSGEPKAPQKVSGVTQYQRWRWGTAEDLVKAAEEGSLCCQLYLSSIDHDSQNK